MSDTIQTIQFTDADWDNIFPVEVVQIGNHQVKIQALSVEDISNMLGKQLPLIMEMFSEEIAIISAGNQVSKDMVFDRLKACLSNVSFFLSESGSNLLASMIPILRAEDIRRFPPNIIVDLLAATLKVNLLSLEQMEKNLNPLMEMFKKMIAMRGAISNE